MLSALLKTERFNITVLKRPSSAATFPASVKVVTADVTSVESVTAALKGQDALVSTVGRDGVPSGSVFVEAAVAAGIKRFIPSDFGPDFTNPLVAAMPLFQPKLAVLKLLREAAAADPGFSWTSISTNPFLEHGLRMNFLLAWKDGQPKFYDGGDAVFSVTSLPSAAQAVVGILSHPEETKNRIVYVKDIDITQKRLLELAKTAAPTKMWQEPMEVSTAALEKASNESIAAGQINPQVYLAYLIRVAFGPAEYGGRFQKVDNELLGIKEWTEDDLEDLLKTIIS